MLSKKERERQVGIRYKKERQRNLLAVPGDHEFIIILDQLKAGYNVGKIFRSAEAFGAKEVHLINIGPFDPSPAKGSFRKVPATFHEDFAACYSCLCSQGYKLFLLNSKAQKCLCHTTLPQKSAFIFGHEEFGFSFMAKEYPDLDVMSIPQFGSVQCLNVSVAASVVMYEYIRQWTAVKN